MKPIVLLLVFSACFSTTEPLSDESKSKREIDVMEAVFKYQFKNNESGHDGIISVYCLAIGKDKDPSDALMQRFFGHVPKVKKISKCEILKADDGRVRDKATGKSGVIFRITEIKWKSPTKVEVTGGYYETILGASTNRYTLTQKQDKWVIRKRKLLSIS